MRKKGKQMNHPLSGSYMRPSLLRNNRSKSIAAMRFCWTATIESELCRNPVAIDAKQGVFAAFYSSFQTFASSMMKSRKALTRLEARNSSGKIKKTSKGGPSISGKTRVRCSFSRAT